MEKKLTGIEKFFIESWESWDEIETGCFVFNDVVPREGVFPSYVEDAMDYIIIDTSNCIIEVYDIDDEILFKGTITCVSFVRKFDA